MRIISGMAKGLRLATPPEKSKAIRPTADRCREALFSILGEKTRNSRVLDLYAGTGAFGLEAISRGATSAIFIDSSPMALSLLRKNCMLVQNQLKNQLSRPPFISICKGDLRKGLERILKYSGEEKSIFDLIFLDPPYDRNLAQATLADLDRSPFLADNGIIVAEERAKVVLSEELEHLVCFDTRRYGDTCFWFYSKKE